MINMNINDLKYGELKEIANLFSNKQTSEKEEIRHHGMCISILDKGFIYIGALTTDDKFFEITKPLNLRSYTSGKGLLWHANHGAENTAIDGKEKVNENLKGPIDKLIHFIPTQEEFWY